MYSTSLCIYLYVSELRAIGLIIAVFVGACSPQSKPTAEIVSHGDMELQFLGVGDSAFSPCRSVTQGKCIPPPSFLPLFSSPLSLAALLCIPPSFHLFHPSACFIFFNSPFVPFSLCFIFHNPIQSLPFRFINRSYTLPPQCCFLLILSTISCFFSLSPSLQSESLLRTTLHCFPYLVPLYPPHSPHSQHLMLHSHPFSHMHYDKTPKECCPQINRFLSRKHATDTFSSLCHLPPQTHKKTQWADAL